MAINLPAWVSRGPVPDATRQAHLRAAASNWIKLTLALPALPRSEVEWLLAQEAQGPCRTLHLHRLLSRALRLRSDGERGEFLAALPPALAKELNRLSKRRAEYRRARGK